MNTISMQARTTIPEGLYGITSEKFSNGRPVLHVVQQMIQGGIKIIQYREKEETKSKKQILKECREIRKITRDAGVLFIVNDYADIAYLCDADGLHIGQDDISVEDARKILGNKIIGLSTHSPEQAQAATLTTADYIGAGPVYGTAIKKNLSAPVGCEYIRYVSEHIQIPSVAIGGIKEHNIKDVIAAGTKRICLVSEITSSDNIAQKIMQLNEIMRKTIA